MKKVPINEIIEFLKNSIFYKPFVYNLGRNGYNLEYYLKNKSSYANIINDAFSWENTIEGHNYWSHVDILYREWYSKREEELNPNFKKVSVDEYLDWLNAAKKYNIQFEPRPVAPNEAQPFVENIEAINNN